jgi:hypothetical protein
VAGPGIAKALGPRDADAFAPYASAQLGIGILLAEEQARAGNRVQALRTLDTALEFARKIDVSAPADAVVLRTSVARCWQAAGSIYALLAGGEDCEQRTEDKKTAVSWYGRALAQWRQLQGYKELLPPQRREMEAAAAAIAAIAKGSAVP